MFQRMDGTILYAMLNHLKPKKYYEVGSGFSSGLVLDMKEMFKLDLKMTFIEPYPDRLESILKENDRLTTIIHKNKIQEIDVSVFEELDENDILFLDTSHIVKTGNDVTYWLFNILPVLKPGVIIHIHDIFWPFEYPKEWIVNQKCYNEIYFIRAFLMNNNDYEILFFNSYVQNEFKAKLIEIDPNLIDNSGASLYLRKK
jgi:predicted O-methyltransferase YrrM